MAKNCKVWHGEAAQAYYEQLAREGKIKPMISDETTHGRLEVADAPPEGAKPQVHNARCAYKPLGQSVGTDSKIDSLAQKNVLTLAPALRAGETAGDKPSGQLGSVMNFTVFVGNCPKIDVRRHNVCSSRSIFTNVALTLQGF